MRVRNELHYEQGRATDILTLRLQGVVATNFNYPQRGILRKTEAFMKDYYMHTQNILSRYSELMDHFYLEDKEAKAAAGINNFLARRKPKKEIVRQLLSARPTASTRKIRRSSRMTPTR